MNKVVLTGRLTRTPELRSTSKNVEVCEFTIATNRPTMRDGKRETDFINCIVWEKLAETLCKYQTKGNMIAVFGELRTDVYEKEGKKLYKTYVLVSNIEFLETKKEEPKKTDPYKEFGDSLEFETKEQEQVDLESEYPF